MKPKHISQHASLRMKQRGIDPLMVELMYTFGDTTYQKGGTEKQVISRKLLKQLRQAIDRLEDVSMILAEDSTVITVMHNHH